MSLPKTPVTASLSITVSMAHVTSADQDRLRSLLHPESDVGEIGKPHWWFAVTADLFTAYPVAGGWLIEIHDLDASDPDGMTPQFSRAFWHLLAWCVDQEFQSVRLDFQAEPNRLLPLA